MLSIAIKKNNIKLCEISKSGKNIKVYSTLMIPTPPGAVNDGVIEQVKEVGDVIREALKNNMIATREVAFTIYSSRIATKEAVIPAVKDNKIAEIIAANSSEYFPVDMNEYIIRHVVLDRYKEDNVEKLKLQLSATPSSMVDAYYNLASSLGLKVLDVDYAGNSIFQAVRQNVGTDRCAVFAIESEGTTVSIFDNGVLMLQRSVNSGTYDMVSNIMDRYGLIDSQEAKQKIKDENLLEVDIDGGEITQDVQLIAGGIKRVTDYFVSRNGGTPLDSAYVVGDVTTMPGFTDIISEQLGMEVGEIGELKGLMIDPSVANSAVAVTEFTANVGAVINPAGITVYVDTEAERAEQATRICFFALIAAAVVSVGLVLVPYVQLASVKSDIKTSTKNILQMSHVEATVNEYYLAEDKLADALNYQSLTVDNNDTLHIFIDELEKKIPQDVQIGSMSISQGSVSMSCTGASKSSVAKFMQQLEKIPSVTGVYVGSLSETVDNAGAAAVTFSLTCSFTNVTPDDSKEADAEAADDSAK